MAEGELAGPDDGRSARGGDRGERNQVPGSGRENRARHRGGTAPVQSVTKLKIR